MGTPSKAKNSKDTRPAKVGAIISETVGNYGKHPFFVKKAEEAKAFLKVAGLPKELARK